MTESNRETSVDDLRQWLRLGPLPHGVRLTVDDVVVENKFERRRVSYVTADGDTIPAFLLVPAGQRSGVAGVSMWMIF
jgi:hypothetical protein